MPPTGLTVDYTKHCRLQFGNYVQVHESHNNMMQEQATGAITLRPTDNAQGVYLFMSLANGWRLNCQSFAPLTLPRDVINSMHRLARCNPRGLNIRYRDQRPFLEAEDGANDDTDDSTYAPYNKENRKNGDERNENDDDTDTNINPPPDIEM